MILPSSAFGRPDAGDLGAGVWAATGVDLHELNPGSGPARPRTLEFVYTSNMADTTYSVADLEAARAELTRWSDAFANNSSNNPNKFQSQIMSARMKVRVIEVALKSAGMIPMTAQEQLESELDKAFPDAQSKQIVEHNGKRYQRRFSPAEMSNSGKTVQVWDRSWVEVK